MAISSREAGWVGISAPEPPAAQPDEGAASSRAQKTKEPAFMANPKLSRFEGACLYWLFWGEGPAAVSWPGLDGAARFAYEPRSLPAKRRGNPHESTPRLTRVPCPAAAN